MNNIVFELNALAFKKIKLLLENSYKKFGLFAKNT
jgi:hypothetical protein